MSQYQPKTVHEGATTGDLQHDEVTATAKSAEDRKAACALASLDAVGNEETITNNKAQVDREAVNKAMESLGGSKSTSAPKAAPSKNIRVDDADVAMLVDQLELPKVKATELLRAHDGDATKAMRAWIKA
ncbi:hypothetical protein E4U54_003319 [Claviceps lovelessii]|nr:hypothetical protein E4U54_003319 [Claviceps lovelessii]